MLRTAVAAALGSAVLLASAEPVAVARGGADERRVAAEPAGAFEPNRGQAPATYRFVARTGGGSVGLAADGSLTVAARGRPDLRMRLAGATATAPYGVARRSGHVNYIRPAGAGSVTDVPRFGAVRFDDVYPGVDLVWRIARDGIRYDFLLRPEGDPATIRLRFPGARRLSVDPHGRLLVRIGGRTLVHRPPRAFEGTAVARRPVAARFVVRGNEVRFGVGRYDRRAGLVIDPTIGFSTYLGGSETEHGNDVAVDPAGNVYVVGTTGSGDFPVKGPFQLQQSSRHWDAYVTKLAPNGALVYSTYYGGSKHDVGSTVAVDAAGSAYIAGHSESVDLPTRDPFQASLNSGRDLFVAKLHPSGRDLVYASYLGGGSSEQLGGIAVDAAGSAYVAGTGFSSGFPLVNPLFTSRGQGFLTKIAPDGRSLVYSTVLRGTRFATDVAVDAAGAAHVVGSTEGDIPTVNAFQPEFGGGILDAYVLKVAPDGGSLDFATYLGGAENDTAAAVAVDAGGSAYVAGDTQSDDFPRVNPARATVKALADAFVTKLSPSGTTLVYSTPLGGGWADDGAALALDADGNAYVGGSTASFDFPVYNAVHPSHASGPCSGASCRDGFVVKLDRTGSRFHYATYLAGRGIDDVLGIATDGAGGAVVAGTTTSTDLPRVRALSSGLAGDRDAFVLRLSPRPAEPKPLYRPGGARPVWFAPFVKHPVDTTTPATAIGDVTGDGRPDLLAAVTGYRRMPADRLLLYRGRADGTLAAPRSFALHGHPSWEGYAIAIADVNGDGRKDAAVTTGLGVDLLLQRGGTLRPARLVRTGQPVDGVVVANVVGDRRKDLLLRGNRSVFVLHRTRAGWKRVTLSRARKHGLAYGDVTGDGRADVVVNDRTRLTVFRRTRTGFAAPVHRPLRGLGHFLGAGVAVADVSGDGRLDAVVTLYGNKPRSLLNVFHQRNGRLGPARINHSYDLPSAIVAADLNGDRRKDIVVGHSAWSRIGVYLNEADGRLGGERLFRVPYASYWSGALSVGDLNGDRRPDIAVAGGYYNGPVVLYQQDP